MESYRCFHLFLRWIWCYFSHYPWILIISMWAGKIILSNPCVEIKESEAKPDEFGLFTGKLTAFILLALGQDNYERFIKGFA